MSTASEPCPVPETGSFDSRQVVLGLLEARKRAGTATRSAPGYGGVGEVAVLEGIAELERLAGQQAAEALIEVLPVAEVEGAGGGQAWQRLRRNWPLLAVLAVQAGLSLRLVWSNTAFTDEALYLWAGHLELAHWLHGTPVPAFQTYFSGAPVIYPPLGAMTDALGGLAAARLLSTAFMLGATCLLYGTGARIAGRKAGACASLVFALLGPVQFLGAFATYDAMALFLLALASWLAIRGGRFAELYLLAAGLTLALADSTKYATALWNPVVLVLAGLTAANGGKLRRSLRASRLAAYAALPAVAALFRFGGPSYVRGLMFTTVARQAGGANASALLVLRDSLNWLWFLLVLAVIGCALAFRGGSRLRGAVMIVCTAAVFLAPLHQAQIHTTISLHKHVAFGAWFGAVGAGYALARGMDAAGGTGKGWRVAAAAAVIAGFAGVTQATQLFVNGWPDMTAAEAVLARSVAVSGCPCLVTADTVTYYYQLRAVYPGDVGEFTGPYYFYYWDPAAQRELSGTAAYLQAVRDHYFNIVEIDPGQPFPAAAAVLRLMADAPGYRQVAALPVSDDAREVIQVWRYSPQAARGGNHAGHV